MSYFIAQRWHVEDVQKVRPDLNKEKCIDVLKSVDATFNAEIGINWSVITKHADKLFPVGFGHE